MEHKEVNKRINHILMDKLGVGEDELNGDTTLKDDLNADPLDIMDICISIEHSFDIFISEKELSSAKTVGQLQNLTYNLIHRIKAGK